MNRVNVDVKNQFIPHPMQLFLVGTYDKEHKANFGMFCWLNFCWDEELCMTFCMDGEKATKTQVKEQGTFSVCLVTEDILPIANSVAAKKGADKTQYLQSITIERGTVLDVPILSDSPYCYELSVKKVIELNGSDIFICKIHNASVPEGSMSDSNVSLSKMKPVIISQKEYLGISDKGICELL